MHADWITYVDNLNLSPRTSADNQAMLAPLTHLSVLSVSGKEAATFLQGQTTCDIKALVDSEPSLGGYCNAKGRTISTFIVIKQQDVYLLILTHDLIDSVRKKLQMYILRSDVQLTDQSDTLCVIGIHNAELTAQNGLYKYPQHTNSYLFIHSADQASAFCSRLIQEKKASPVNQEAWLALDIQAGIPWLFQETSEDFVPQMLNLDKLAAISFNKGCYTGQEIVARTHYLGKNKRAMYRASCASAVQISPGTPIVAAGHVENQLGTVILAARQNNMNHLLIVLKDQAHEVKNLQLNNQNRDKISVDQIQD